MTALLDIIAGIILTMVFVMVAIAIIVSIWAAGPRR